MRRHAARLHPGLAVAALLLAPRAAGACAVCFGDPGSPASKGLTAAVLFLGLWPLPLFEIMEPSITRLLEHILQSKIP